jgi:hypothetical protein
MSKLNRDEEFEKVVARIFADAGLSEREADRVADSAELWWSIKREIARKPARSPWPPSKLWRWIAIPSLAVASAILVVFLEFSVDDRQAESAQVIENVVPTYNNGSIEPTAPVGDLPKINVSEPASVSEPAARPSRPSASRAFLKRPTKPRDSVTAASAAPKMRPDEPIKSDFIALSLAPQPSSGQIVKLRVPSSMMVSVGLVDSVKKPSAMVDAEVLMGDDGTTHSIRFIR